MASYNNKGEATFPATATSISAGRRVNIDSAGAVSVADNTIRGIGVVLYDVAASGLASVRLFSAPGTHFMVVTAQPITVGDVLYAAAAGRVANTGTVLIGKANGTSLVNDITIEAFALPAA